jgi:hypothetical protein
MWRSSISFAVTLFGISCFCYILSEVIKKIKWISDEFSALWIILPVCLLYSIKELSKSRRFKDYVSLSPDKTKYLEKLFNTLLILFSVLAVIAIPFLWYGVILETIRNAFHGHF